MMMWRYSTQFLGISHSRRRFVRKPLRMATKKHFRAKTVKRARPRIQATRYSERLEKPLEKRKKKEIDLHPDAVMRDRLNCYFPFDCSQSERKAYFSNFAPSLIRSYSSFQTGMKKVMKVWPAMLSLCLLALTPL